MSHIDSFRHEIVGIFAGLPVYRPLEVFEGGEIEGTPKQLLIGGGSGEHPAVLLNKPEVAVLTFLEVDLTSSAEHLSRKDPRNKFAKTYLPVVREALTEQSLDDVFRYFDWLEDDHTQFRERCNKYAHNPYDFAAKFESSLRDFDRWLACSLGEFIYFAMPELAPDIMSKIQNPYATFAEERFNNIMLIPPNMPVCSNGGNAWTFERRNPPVS